MKKFLLGAFVLVLLIQACSSDELKNPLDVELKKAVNRASPTGSYEHFILPDPSDYDAIPQDPTNPLTDLKVELGRMLFYETGIALKPLYPQAKGTYSCSTCHIPEAGFMPGRAQGIADGGAGFGLNGESRTKFFFYKDNEPDVQSRRALSLFNVSHVNNSGWAGQFGGTDINIGTEEFWTGLAVINELGLKGPESQAIETFDLHRLDMNEAIADSLGYKPYFDAVFGHFPPSTRYGRTTTGYALAAYTRTLSTNQAPFQKWLKGNEYAMSDEEKEGALLFFGKAACYKCHNGKALHNPTQFYAVGAKDLYETGQAINTGAEDPANLGRGGFTQQEEDMYKFKVPQLYNMKLTPFFFHGSSKSSLREVVDYFNDAIPENSRIAADKIAPQFRPLNLTEDEKEKLVLFLEHSLYDAEYHRFIPAEVLSGNCFPNNDPQSRYDLGCN